MTGLNGRWRLACSFYLSSLIGTACTDLMMALTGVMKFWPSVVTAPFDEAPELLHNAGMQLLHPFQLVGLALAAAVIIGLGQRLRMAGENWEMAGAVLVTTVWVDGLFLLTALLQPGLSGLIE